LCFFDFSNLSSSFLRGIHFFRGYVLAKQFRPRDCSAHKKKLICLCPVKDRFTNCYIGICQLFPVWVKCGPPAASYEEKLMRKLMVSKMLISAFLLAAVVAGCGDSDKNGNAGSPGAPTTPPTVISVTPLNASTSVCPNNGLIIGATFSKPMNPATIDTTTFTLTGPGGTSVTGAVSYIATTDVATFTPSGALTANTAYNATVTTGAKDTFGNALAANFTWTFTTSPVCAPPGGGTPIALGAACTFGILGATPVVSSIGPTAVTGDVGIWPALSITGFPPGTKTGAFHAGDAIAQTAQGDLTTAYNNAAGAAGGAVLTADIGGQTLAPGVYKTTSAQPTLGITGNLTLSGTGVYIFQIVSALTTAAGPGASQVTLSGGATAHNVFWQVGSSATLGSGSTFAGTIMAKASITLGTGAILNGRALAETGAISLDSNPVNVPPCP
jgi:hypothetical protein